MRERTERVERPGTYVTMSFTRPFLLRLVFFWSPSRALVFITWRGVGCSYMMRLGETVKMAQLLKINAQVSSI